MIKVVLAFYFLIGILCSVMGLATRIILDNADESPRYDYVYKINDAFIGKTQHLYVCVDGRYDGREQQYWLFVPVAVIEKTPEKLDMIEGYSSYWKASYKQLWNLPRENIRLGDCQSRPSDAVRTVPIKVLEAAMNGSFATERILNQRFALEAETELVYQLNVSDGAGQPIKQRDMAYANKYANFTDTHTMMFKTNYHMQRGSFLWYLLLPFGWALDVLLWPIELYVWSAYADAHH